eukprot:3302403-Pyramimonas_sp.AAC.1
MAPDAPTNAPGGPHEEHRRPLEAPKRPPRCPQEAPKRPPRGLPQASKTPQGDSARMPKLLMSLRF